MTTEMTRMKVLEAVLAERERQDDKWGIKLLTQMSIGQ